MIRVSLFKRILPLALLIYCPLIGASQYAIVTADQAIIYSDTQMSSPLGFLRKGKKIKVGDISRNKAQVYPIIISGKMAWIRVVDVTTERESADSTRLTAERFQKRTYQREKGRLLYSLSYLRFASQVSLNGQTDGLAKNDPLTWSGVSLRGEGWISQRWDLQILTNFLIAEEGVEKFKILEVGAGGGLKLYRGSVMTVRLDTQAMFIPFATYEYSTLFLKRGYGYTLGTGLNFGFQFGTNWGMEAYGGFYYSKLINIDSPEPYLDISPSFMGTRLGIGLTYQL